MARNAARDGNAVDPSLVRRGAARLVRRVDELGRITDDAPRLTRTFLSPAMARANARVGRWMREAGMSVREDVVGNLIGRWESQMAAAGRPARTLVLGSHLDTVRDAGRFDGALGVLVACSAVEVVRRSGIRLPFAVEVVGFAEEEGVRFSSSYIGSKAYNGALRSRDLRLRDAGGATLGEVLARRFRNGVFARPGPAHQSSELLGYVEVHIEQGPVLAAAKLPLGVVSAIAGFTRGGGTFVGRAGHAGTTPMALRRDALTGAAEWIQGIEDFARQSIASGANRSGLVATVGTLAVAPGAINVIPGSVSLSVDVRHARNSIRVDAVHELVLRAKSIAARRGLDFRWETIQEQPAVTCDEDLTGLLKQSVIAATPATRRPRSGSFPPTLVSGAGHDAVVMSNVTPVAMLFVRCRDGLSHHPDEFAAPADIAAALHALCEFLGRGRGYFGSPMQN